jgi:hypothetical protein
MAFPDEDDGFLRLAAFHSMQLVSPPQKKLAEILKLFDFDIARVRDCNL